MVTKGFLPFCGVYVFVAISYFVNTDNKSEPEHDVLAEYLGRAVDGELSATHRSGFVAVVGKPNVGKSTLVNALIGHKVAITSNKPQTTRRRILGILTRDDLQILFVDTPGIHQAKQALNRYMMSEVDEALSDCDAILFVVDVSHPPSDDDQRVAEWINSMPQPKIMAMNKSDTLDPRAVVANVAAYEMLVDNTSVTGHESRAMLTSATRGDNLDKLLVMVIAVMPLGPEYFPGDQATDQTERMLASEFIREQALRLLEQEVPHGIAVAIEEWQPRPNDVIYIAATIYVERDSQKGILIGKGGAMLKTIGVHARKEIQRELNTKVFLELWVKVREGWRKDDMLVRRFLEGS